MKKVTLITLAAGVMLSASWGAAQVVRTQSGDALDANPSVSGGRFNPVSPNARINSQLYVTGQVTGLGAFRGEVGYLAPDQIQLDLPSAEFQTFRGQSVGYGDLTSGVYGLTSYRDRASTALPAGDIVAGRAAAGTSIPRRSRSVSSFEMRLISDAMKDYKDVAPLSPITKSLAGAKTRSYLSTIRGSLSPDNVSDRSDDSDNAFGSTATPFDLLNRTQSRRLASDLYDLVRVDATYDLKVEGKTEKRAEQQPTDLQDALPLEKDTSRTDYLPPVAAVPKTPVRSNQDAFIDLLIRFRQQRISGETPLPDDELWQQETQSGSSLVEFSRENTIVIRALAGKGDDFFNRRMSKAEALLKDGRYYAAARAYDNAATLKRSNPMAQMGMCLSYFAAGEPLTAAHYLRRCFALFPPIMQTRVDIGEIIGENVFRHRMRVIDERRTSGISLKDERMLTFISTFMHHNFGHAGEAQRSAEMLAKLSKGDKLLGSYAKYVITGELPGKDNTTTQPAAGNTSIRGK